MNVLFVCVGNQGRSVMAEQLFRRAAGGRHEARSAGSAPGRFPHPGVVDALAEVGIDASDHVPRKLDPDALAWADVAVTCCADEVCPTTPGVDALHWPFRDPAGLAVEEVRPIREEIDARVRELASDLG